MTEQLHHSPTYRGYRLLVAPNIYLPNSAALQLVEAVCHVTERSVFEFDVGGPRLMAVVDPSNMEIRVMAKAEADAGVAYSKSVMSAAEVAAFSARHKAKTTRR